MILLDAAAVLAVLLDEPARAEVEAMLGRECAIAALNLAEVQDRLVRRYGAEEGDADRAVALLKLAGVEVAPLYEDIAVAAGRLRAKHYHRRERPVSLADCVMLATAMEHGMAVASSDGPVLTIAEAVGLDVRPLPDSAGRPPAVG